MTEKSDIKKSIIKELTENELYEMISRYCGWGKKIQQVQIVSAVRENDNSIFEFVKP